MANGRICPHSRERDGSLSSRDAKYTKPVEELWIHLREGVHFLRVSAAAFDQGFEAEAKRLATTIRVLVHDTKNQKSLLHQLNLKHKLRMHNTARPFDPTNPLMHQGLVILKVEAGRRPEWTS